MKRSTLKRAILIIFTAILTVCMTSCAKTNKDVQEITLSEVTHSVFYAPQYAALSLGFFEEEGLEIELLNGGGADKVMTAVLSGDADIGLAGPEASIYVMNEGSKNYSVIFAQLTKRDGSFLVGRKKEDFSWDNLKGITLIGGRKGGVPEMTLEYVLKANGLDPNTDLTVDTSIAFDLMAGAFTSGNGDYVTLFEPTASMLEMENKGFVLTSIGSESGEIPYTAYFASNKLVKNDPELIQRFTNAVAKGQKWVAEHTPEEVAEAIAPYFTDTDISVLTNVVKRYKDIDAWNTDPIMKKESLERLEEVMEEAGELEKRVEFDKLVDNSFAENAISNLK